MTLIVKKITIQLNFNNSILLGHLRLLSDKLLPVVHVQYQLVSSLECHRCSSCSSDPSNKSRQYMYLNCFFLLHLVIRIDHSKAKLLQIYNVIFFTN